MSVSDQLPAVVLVPGGISPAAITYAPVMRELQGRARLAPKDLEVYASDTPPPHYTIEMEAEAIGQYATRAGFGEFHLVGFSGGGAAALVYTALHSDRVLSLALTEPAWIGNRDLSPEELAYWDEASAAAMLPDERFMAAFASAEMAPGVAPPPFGPPPDWMRSRPAALRAMMRAFKCSDFQVRELSTFTGPVYLALGSDSSPRYAAMRDRLCAVVPQCTSEVYEGTSHMHPPHLAEPARYARAVEGLWGGTAV